MSLEKVVRSVKRSKKGIGGKALGALLGIALLANISGCGRKVKIKAPAMPLGMLNGVITDTYVNDETCDDILIPNDGKPEFYVSLDRIGAATATFYVDDDFKDKVGDFHIQFLGQLNGKNSAFKHFNYKKYKRGIYSDSIKVSAKYLSFVLKNKYYDGIDVRELLHEAEGVKQFYKSTGKMIIWHFQD